MRQSETLVISKKKKNLKRHSYSSETCTVFTTVTKALFNKMIHVIGNLVILNWSLWNSTFKPLKNKRTKTHRWGKMDNIQKSETQSKVKTSYLNFRTTQNVDS